MSSDDHRYRIEFKLDGKGKERSRLPHAYYIANGENAFAYVFFTHMARPPVIPVFPVKCQFSSVL